MPDASPPPNRALHFDGTEDYATTGTAGFPRASLPVTISLWVQYPSADGTQVLVVLRSDFVSGLILELRDRALGVWTVFQGTVLVQAPELPAPGVWHHLAYVFDGTVSMLYVDGAAVAMSTAPTDNRSPSWCSLGSLDGESDFYGGEMDEIRVWNVARSSDEIVEEMNGQVSAPAPGLVAYFDCNTVVGTRVPDESGNGNDATLGGGDPQRMPTLVPSSVP